MKLSLRFALPAALALLAVCSAPAQTIIGAWSYGNTSSPASTGTGVFVFLSNGVYFHAESDNIDDAANGPTPAGGDVGLGGIERGTYSWASNVFTMGNVAVNTNGGWGLSDVTNGTTSSFVVSGNTLTVDGAFTLSRVTGASPLVGAWTFGNTVSPDANGTGVMVFLPNNVYFHIESESSDTNGTDGMERGTYLWNGTDTLTLTSVAVDTNGQWGLFDDPGVGNTMDLVVSGDILTAAGAFNLNRVSAIPEPSTYAALAGLGALSFAAWRRRQLRAA